MAVHVSAPLTGRAIGLVDVPDPVFSTAMVGPGLAIEPAQASDTVVAPVAGKLVKLKAHALVVLADGGRGILVHLGIDTVRLGGQGFTLLATEGDTVEAGQPLVRWNPTDVAARGFSPVCPIVALDAPTGAVEHLASGPITVGAPLFTWN